MLQDPATAPDMLGTPKAQGLFGFRVGALSLVPQRTPKPAWGMGNDGHPACERARVARLIVSLDPGERKIDASRHDAQHGHRSERWGGGGLGWGWGKGDYLGHGRADRLGRTGRFALRPLYWT